MKKIAIISAIILFNIAFATAQDTPKTLFQMPKIKQIGFYISPEYQNGQLSGNFKSFQGISASVIFNNRFSVGLFNNSIFSPNYTSTTTDEANNARYGGLKLEYTLKPNSIVHYTIPVYIGMGSAQSTLNSFRGGNRNLNSFFVGQTGFQVEVNLFKFMKVYTGSTYRFSDLITQSTSTPLAKNTLSGLSFDFGLKIGMFGKSVKK
ncbi:MAG: hypothetical protein HYZ42_08740 [Bacteroidetes bacterium]|nr:hypothetical protein [Bacteroidota bacterium]